MDPRGDKSEPPFAGRNRSGERICVWCGKPLSGRKLRWYSDICVNEYLARRSQAGMMRFVWKRDRGVCARCGLDTEAVEEAIRELWAAAGCGSVTVEDFLLSNGFKTRSDYKRALWEAHHVQSVVEGGVHDPGNVITLCMWCHRRETALLARRRRKPRTMAGRFEEMR